MAEERTEPDGGLQQERTSLAWERTAIATMVMGTLLGRYGAQDGHLVVALAGLFEVAFGAGLLVWSGVHHDELHRLTGAGETVAFPNVVRVVGIAAIAFTTAALVSQVLLTVT